MGYLTFKNRKTKVEVVQPKVAEVTVQEPKKAPKKKGDK